MAGIMAAGAAPFVLSFTPSATPRVTMNYGSWTRSRDPAKLVWLGQNVSTNISFDSTNIGENPTMLYVVAEVGTNDSLPSIPCVFDTNNFAAYFASLSTNSAGSNPPPIIVLPPTNTHVSSPP